MTILILGGARAGKSTFALRVAEERAGNRGVAFIATAQALDDEMAHRITRHRKERPTHWATIEEPHQLDEALLQTPESGVVIIDCLTLFVSNWLLRLENARHCEQTVQEITERVLTLSKSQTRIVICVSNEVGLGIVPDTPLGRTFRDLLGRINQQFAEAADEVYLLVAGLPLRLKPRDLTPPMHNPNQLEAQIEPLDQSWIEKAAARQLTLTKPPGSLGRLEETANRLAAIQRTTTPNVSRKRIYVVAADHGVTAEGVSAYPREVTAQMVENFLAGGAAINVLGRHGDIDVKVVDAGVDADLAAHDRLIDVKSLRGTANFARGPAMSHAEAERLVTTGVDLARATRKDGIQLLGIGEMGIGNTTAASAITAALTSADPHDHTDRGTGVDDHVLTNKIEVIRRALAVNQPDPNNAIDVLAKVGGAEIAVMMGLVIGAAVNRIAVIADGFISTAAAALAVGLCPDTRGYLFLAHRSVERGHAALIRLIGLEPLLDLKMRLGEGTGAALAMHLLDASARLLSEMATFSEANVSNKA